MSTTPRFGTKSWEAAQEARAVQRRAWQVRHRYREGSAGRASLVMHRATFYDMAKAGQTGADINPGDQVMQLRVGHAMWMSDSNDEYRDHREAIERATGRVLIHGLGLGCYLSAILTKPDVTHVDVVEKDGDVVALVGPYFAHDARVQIHYADAFAKSWPKGTRWDVAWHDVWENKCTDDLAEHAKFMRSFARRVGWQGCWAHEYLVAAKRRGL